jgi:hypothetical protein
VYDHDYSTEKAHVRLFQPYLGYFCWKGLRGNAVPCMGTPIDVHSALEDFCFFFICPRHPRGMTTSLSEIIVLLGRPKMCLQSS